MVFAVSWRGPTPPNLSDLLGSYFQQIQAAPSTQKHRSLSHATVATGDVIVQTGGICVTYGDVQWFPHLFPTAWMRRNSSETFHAPIFIVSLDSGCRLRRQQFVALIFSYDRSDSDRCAHVNPNTDRLEQPPYNVNFLPFRNVNIPTASVTVCAPGTPNCQTITGLLVDTGSFGLRIFSSVLTVPLQQQEVSGEPIGECVFFGSFTTWGPVELADVQIGNEPKILSMPLQIIGDSNFASAPADCLNGSLFPPATAPAQIFANGVIGVGLRPQDCGTPCESMSVPTNPTYYSCNSVSPSGTCTATPQALSDQAPNPVAKFPVDNNGVVVKLPYDFIERFPQRFGRSVVRDRYRIKQPARQRHRAHGKLSPEYRRHVQGHKHAG